MNTVDSIVRNVLLQPRFRGEEFDVTLQYALRGVKEICGIRGMPKTVFLEVNANNVAKLPDDYISYTKIGVCVNDRFYSLGYNDKLCSMEKDCSTATQVDTAPIGFYFNNFALPEGGIYGRIFGFGVVENRYGEYHVNEQNGTVEFSDDLSGDPIMEYVSTGWDIASGTAMVDPLAEETLIAWTEWKTLQGRGNMSPGEVREAERNYLDARDEYVTRKFSFTFDEFKDAINYGYMQAPKH